MKHPTFSGQSDAVCVWGVCVGGWVGACVLVGGWVRVWMCVMQTEHTSVQNIVLHHLELSTFVTWDMGGKPL